MYMCIHVGIYMYVGVGCMAVANLLFIDSITAVEECSVVYRNPVAAEDGHFYPSLHPKWEV